jgi:lysophospholipase L1-like esterase
VKHGARWGTIALLAGGLLFAFVASELLIRLFAKVGGDVGRSVATADPMAVKVIPHGVMGYRQKPGAAFTYPSTGAVAHANSSGYRGPDVATPKPAGTFRVILLGESSSHGYGVADSQTIDAYMREELARRAPGRAIEVVNLAFDGYDAWQIWQRLLTDGLPRSPDLVILNTGVNDVRNARYANLQGDPDPRTLLWGSEIRRLQDEAARGGPTLWTRLKHHLYLARLPGLLRQRAAAKSSPQAMLQTAVHPDAMANFERNLTRIADTLTTLGVPLLLSTPPSALLMEGVTVEMVPRSYWIVDARTTQQYRDSLNVRLRVVGERMVQRGGRAVYVPHTLAPTMFLDDCHLTAEGNRVMAQDFAAAAEPFLAARR